MSKDAKWIPLPQGCGSITVEADYSRIQEVTIFSLADDQYVSSHGEASSPVDISEEIRVEMISGSPRRVRFTLTNDIVRQLKSDSAYDLAVRVDGVKHSYYFKPDPIVPTNFHATTAWDKNSQQLSGARGENTGMPVAPVGVAVQTPTAPAERKRSGFLWLKRISLILGALLLLALLGWGGYHLMNKWLNPDSLEVEPKQLVKTQKTKVPSLTVGSADCKDAKKASEPNSGAKTEEGKAEGTTPISSAQPMDKSEAVPKQTLEAGEVVPQSKTEQPIVSKSKRVVEQKLTTREVVRQFFKRSDRTPEAAYELSKTLSVASVEDQDAVFRLYYFAAESGVKAAFVPYARTLDPNTEQWGTIHKDAKLALNFYRQADARSEAEALLRTMEQKK